MDLESSTRLLARARAGDRAALNTLFDRYLPQLRRWASGRLPRWARDVRDTTDLVQDVAVQTVGRIDAFRPTRRGSLSAYLRQAVINRIRDEIRRARRKPPTETLPDLLSAAASPLEMAIAHEERQRYARALARLRPSDRDALVARLELGYDYDRLASVLGKPTAGAARLAAIRAVNRLAEEIAHDAARR